MKPVSPVPTIGRIVLVPIEAKRNGPEGPIKEVRIRPAIVTEVFSPTLINVRVFSDGANDMVETEWITSIELDQDDHRPGTWHWMPFQIQTIGHHHKDRPKPTAAAIESIAKVCHAVNRAYCQALGDASQPEWDDAPDWQRDSAMKGVQFHIDNPEAGPEASHLNWLAQKKAEGWKYGPKKDPEKKEHPCCIPFYELPVEQQAKDFIFRSIVHALVD